MSTILTALIFFFAILSGASAQEESPISQWVKDHVKGSFRYKNFAHFKDTKLEQRTVRQEGILRLEIEQTFLDNWRLFLVPQWKADTANYTAEPFQDFRDTLVRDSYFYIREGHLKYRGDNFDFAVGKQFYNWGTADGYNPTDNLNPRNYLDVPDREKMGIFSFSASYYPPDASLTFVVVPLFTPSRAPVSYSRWAIPPTPGVVTLARDIPEKQLEKTQMGFRAKKTIAGWDLSLSYFDGYDTLSFLRQRNPPINPLNLLPLGPVTMEPRFNRMRVIGMDFSTTQGKFEYHGEWAWKFYDGGRAADLLPFIFGGMYTWDEDQVRWLGLEQMRFNLEYAGEITLHKRDNLQYKASGIFTRPFQNSILSRLTLKVDEDNELIISGSGNFHGHNNSFLQPKFIHKFSDTFKVEGGWEVFWGAQNSFWGKWKRNDRTFVFLTYLF